MSLHSKLQQALALHQQGRLAQAQSLYQQILAEQPRHFDALHLSGVIAAQSRNPRGALKLIDQALEIDASNAVTHFNRATALQDLKEWQAALGSYDRAIAIKPDFAEAYSNRGVVLTNLDRMEAAIASCNQAIALRSNFAQAFFNRGNVYRDLMQWEAALESYDRAAALDESYAEAFFNRGEVLSQLKRWKPALASYDQAIASRPNYARAYANRGNVLKELAQLDAALASYRHAMALEPGLKFLYGQQEFIKMELCDWDDREADAAQLAARIERGEPACHPFQVLAASGSARLQRKAAEIWVVEACPPDASLPPIPKRRRREKIRIGYFSADFRAHAVAFLTAELFETHDRARFEVLAFSLGRHTQDEMRERLERGFDRFLDVSQRSDQDVALLARSMELDIAIDLGGFTEDSRTRIFGLRAAPLQVSYIGYLGTMAAEHIDYLIADPVIVPSGCREHYTEKILYLPSYQANDSKRRLSERLFTREELGLPPSGFVFCCFNRNYKLTHATFSGWLRILGRVQGSVLFLYAGAAAVERNLRKEARSQGVDPDRLVFGRKLAPSEYLARYKAADLFLDTLPYNAGTTASDALWAGLPVLTCAGEAFASRVGASLLTAIEMPELITTTQERYEELAVDLANDPQRLAEIKQRLAAKRLTAPLFDIRLFTKHLETAYTRIYERYQADLPPEDIHIERQSIEQQLCSH